MALSVNGNESFRRMIENMSKSYGANCTKGFHISDADVIGYSKKCFNFFDFAKTINIITVDDRNGSSFLSFLGSPASSRTDVKMKDRDTTGLFASATSYEVAQMNTDIHIPYALINQWSMSEKDFSKSYCEYIQRRIGTDRLIAGWHGVDVHSTTNPTTNPLLTNVAKGWLYQMITQAPDRVLGTGSPDLDITIGENGTFANLDSAVLEMISMIPEIHRHDLVCIVGDTLLQAEQDRVYSNSTYLFDKHKNAEIFNQFGNIPRVSCVGFPTTGLVVTSLANLSIYIKSGTSFRQMLSNVKRERVEDYHSTELAYVVENPQAFYALHPDNVSIPAMQESQEEKSIIRKLMNLQNVNAQKVAD